MSARIVSVTGGTATTAMSSSEVLGLAGRFDDLAGELATLSARTATGLGDVHLLESATVAPRSFAEVEAGLAFLAEGTFACAATWEASAFGCRELVRTLHLVDLASAAAMHGVDAALASAVLADPLTSAPILLADPSLLQHVVAGVPSRLLARLLGGAGETGVRLLPGPPTCGRSPRSVADLITRLDEVGDLPDGTIDVQTHLLADGTRVHVAYLPGTDQIWSDGFTAQLRDMKENGRILAGEPTAYAAGIRHALAAAGVVPGERVLLVGHSQGGMQAAQLLAEGSGYDVSDVVTAGSPIAEAGTFPDASHVLSLENRTDLVPELDGADNPATPGHVTVRFDDGPDDPLGSHDLAHYVDGAAAVDASSNPVLRASVAELEPFLAPADVTSRLFVLTRDVSSRP